MVGESEERGKTESRALIRTVIKMNKSNRKMWQFPWQYKESIVFAAGIVVIGFALQIFAGPFDFFLLHYPVNLVAGGLLILLPGLLLPARRSPFYQWLSGVPFSVTLIGALLAFCLIMGLTPQVLRLNPHSHDLISLLGFRQMTSSWPFVLLYLMLLLTLGALIARRLAAFKIRDYAFYLNHIGLWLLLFSAGLGASDTKRYIMHVREGETEWRVYSETGEVLELPVAIQLNDFDMEEYPPKLAVIHRETGRVLPESKPEFFAIDEKRPEGRLSEWDIRLEEYIHQAIRNSDSTYHEMPMPGASPAARVSVVNSKSGRQASGWVCCGNVAQLYMMLPLDEEHCVVMTRPEPKRFLSDIQVFTEEGGSYGTVLEVNKPLRIGHWTIYQYGYDNEAGKLSSYSSMELVYDPWLYPAYAGILLLGAGAVCLLWSGSRRRRKSDDME